MSVIIHKIKQMILRTITPYYLVSFPKSGRTWVRFFLGKYFSHKYQTDFFLKFLRWKTIHPDIPRIGMPHTEFHRDTVFTTDSLKGKKLVLLARDPRDVVVSFYFQCTKRESLVPSGTTLSEFIRLERFGIVHVIDFLNTVYAKRNRYDEFLLISYEQLKTQPNLTFRNILKHFGETDINEESFDYAMAESSFENMKKTESSKKLADNKLQPGNTNDPESFKVRKGKVGGYIDYFSEADMEYVNNAMEKLNPVFGYR